MLVITGDLSIHHQKNFSRFNMDPLGDLSIKYYRETLYQLHQLLYPEASNRYLMQMGQ